MNKIEYFYVIQYGVRSFKYLGGYDSDRYRKVNDISSAIKFGQKDFAEKHLDIFEKGRIIKIKATYEMEIEGEV